MKPGKFFGLVAVLITLTAVAFGQAAPKIVIPKTEHNFGEIKKGADAAYTFIFKNEGKADLEIKRVAPS